MTDEHRSPAALIDVALRTRALTDNASVGLVLMDARQHCTFLNPAAEKMFGFTLAELQGKPLHDFVHHSRPDGTPYPIEECPIDRALPNRIREHGEDVFVRRDGTYYPVSFTASPIFERDVVIGTVLELRDITEDRARREVELERERNVALMADVAAALTQRLELREMLTRCCEAIVLRLDAAFARIWTIGADAATLHLQASAGLYTHVNGPHARVPVGALKIGTIAAERKPHLTNDVLHDARVSDREWAAREGMVSFAGYPLLLEGRVVGVMALFARRALGPEITEALASIADAIALGAERLRIEDARRESEERFRNMADNAPVMLWVTDPNGACTYLNKRWYEFTGQTEESGLGFGWLRAVHPDDAKLARELFDRANTRHEAFRVEYRLLRKDGTYRWAIDTASPRFGLDGDYLGYVGSVIDIADRKSVEDEIKRVNASLEQRVRERTARLEDANRELEAFSYSVSHDLRAPLRHIVGFCQLLERRASGVLDDKGRQYLTTITVAARRGGQLVDELLEFSRLGRTELKKERVSLAQLITDVKNELAPEWSERRVSWNIGALPNVDADAGLMRAVLRNLLSNALKYSRNRSEAVIRVHAREDDHEVELSVTDNGVGFDPAHADKLFGVFQRLHPGTEFEGVGIGLANVRRIVERHGGRVTATGAPDSGATFTLTLPRAREALFLAESEGAERLVHPTRYS